MSASYNKSHRWPVVIDGDFLGKIGALFSEKVGPIEIRAFCKDDILRHFKTIKELLAYENTKEKGITKLKIEAASETIGKSASLRISSSWLSTIDIEIEANEDMVTKIKKELYDYLDGVRPFYSPIHKINFIFLLVGIFLCLYFYVIIAQTFKWMPENVDDNRTIWNSSKLQVGFWLLWVVMIGGGYILNKTRDFFYPLVYFKIGQNVKKFDDVYRAQWQLIGSLIGIGSLIWAGLKMLF